MSILDSSPHSLVVLVVIKVSLRCQNHFGAERLHHVNLLYCNGFRHRELGLVPANTGTKVDKNVARFRVHTQPSTSQQYCTPYARARWLQYCIQKTLLVGCSQNSSSMTKTVLEDTKKLLPRLFLFFARVDGVFLIVRRQNACLSLWVRQVAL